MSVAAHLDALLAYRSMAVRIVPIEGDPEDMLGEGGALAETFEELGQEALVGVLRDPRVASAVLADRDLEIEVRREGSEARLQVRWDGLAVVDDPVEIPDLQAASTVPLFRPNRETPVADVAAALREPDVPLFAVSELGQVRWFRDGRHGPGVGAVPLRAQVKPLRPEQLGSAAFREAHGVRLAYVAGAMAGGIGSVAILRSMADAGMLGFFGSGGLPLEAVQAALVEAASIPGGLYGFNLLHNPVEPAVEEHTVDLYLGHGVRRISASAYMGLTSAVVRFRLTGIHAGPDGTVVCPNSVFAKVSRLEVAEHFLRPAPANMLAALVASGALTEAQAKLAARVPIAEDITAEADSGGHTDRRPLLSLLPALQGLRDRIAAEEGYAVVPRVGAAGGLGTPEAVWGAFAMGADYVLTGSVNQATREAGTSDAVKAMLATATFTDVATGPAPDMFEIGAHVQVLSRGTMYAKRAQRLYDLYKSYDSLEAIPEKDRGKIERQLFRRSIDEVWADTQAYWSAREPAQLERAEREPRHKMALVFRWYLGMTSRWARTGDAQRKLDYQVWCGPAMGAFNAWAAGTELEPVEARGVVEVAEALMGGAAALGRACSARMQGVLS